MGILLSILSETPEGLILSRPDDEHDGYSIRLYRKYISASTMVSSSSSDDSFQRLAGYIGVLGTAKNDKSRKIGMTVPVLVTYNNPTGGINMEFVLPLAEGDAPPNPSDPRVSIKNQPESRWAVKALPMSIGLHSWDRVRENAAALREKLKKDGFKLPDGEGVWRLAIYRGPFNFWQSNYIHVHLPL
jgi:hypothetical protein